MKLDIDKDIGMHLPTPGRKSRCFSILLVLLSLFGLTGLGLHQNNYLVFDHKDAAPLVQPELQDNHHQEQLKKENQELKKLQTEFNELKKQLVVMNRENAIQQATNKELNKKLLNVEDELSEAKKKQLLYEDILAPDNLKQGLHVRHFGLSKKETHANERRYRYMLVLSQARGGKKIIQGQYIIRLTGKENGKSKNYSHREIAADGIEANRKFSLKYYQSLEGEIMLPEGFEPEKVTLWIMPKSKNYSNQSKNYQWKPLINQKK